MNDIATTTQQQLVPRDDSPFAMAQREAKALSQSDLVPKAFQGKIANCLIALEIARRIGAPPLLVMQNLYIVQGKPAWSSTFLIATVNACGRFTPLRFEIDGGTDPSNKNYRVRAVAKDREFGDVCTGPWITWKMIDAEGWSKKTGSKWLTLPELMFMYRAAGFWTRVYAPELSMGILTAEEVSDIGSGAPEQQQIRSEDVRKLEQELLGTEPQPVPVDDDQDALVTLTELQAKFDAAQDMDALDEAYNDVGLLPMEDRDAATSAYNLRRDTLELP